MWTAIENVLYVLLFVALLCLLWYWVTPKKECFTVILKAGGEYQGHILYRGKRDQEALRAEIIAKVEEQFPGEQVERVYIG